MKFFRLLAILIAVGFALLPIMGFDNVFALLRSRVALFLVISPVFLFFIWCIYKAFQPQNRLPEPSYRDKKSRP